MNELTNYLPMLLALVLALTLVTNIIVQVLKGLPVSYTHLRAHETG